MRRRAAVDANQAAIVSALRSAGVLVHPLHTAGQGCPDLLCGFRRPNRLALVEVKDGAKRPSERRLTPAQVAFFEEWAGFAVYVVTSVDEALALVSEREFSTTFALSTVTNSQGGQP